MEKSAILKTYYSYIMALSRIGFNSVYQDNTFTVLYSELLYSICSIDLDNNNSILISLASPYLVENKYTSSLEELFINLSKISIMPVRSITIKDLPILSRKELLQIKNNEVNDSVSDKLPIVSFNSKCKMKGYNDKIIDENYLLSERLEYLPDDIKELVGYKLNKVTYDYEPATYDKKDQKIISYRNRTKN